MTRITNKGRSHLLVSRGGGIWKRPRASATGENGDVGSLETKRGAMGKTRAVRSCRREAGLKRKLWSCWGGWLNRDGGHGEVAQVDAVSIFDFFLVEEFGMDCFANVLWKWKGKIPALLGELAGAWFADSSQELLRGASCLRQIYFLPFFFFKLSFWVVFFFWVNIAKNHRQIYSKLIVLITKSPKSAWTWHIYSL